MSSNQPAEANQPHYPLLYLSITFLLGIIFSSTFHLPAWAILVCVGIGPLLWFVQHYWFEDRQGFLQALPLPLGLLIIAFSFGVFRHQLAQPKITPAYIAYYNDGENSMGLTGVIASQPELRDRYVQVEIRAESFYEFDVYEDHVVDGRVLVRLPLEIDWQYGDRVAVFGLLQTPPEDEMFSYRQYLARNGVFSYMPYATAEIIETDQGNPFLSAIFSFKGAAMSKIYQLWPDPEASLLAGILLGVESGIPEDVENAFINTGTSHIIAISGFNFTILVGIMITTFSRWLGQRRGAVLAVVTITVYTILVGASAAVVRAALMGGLGLFARQLGRRQDGLTSLSFVAVLMAVWNPYVLWDVGFQLSFAATLGLIIYVDPLTNWFQGLLPASLEPGTARQLTNAAGEYFLFTIAAQITTLPILIYHFQRLSIISLPANFAILPAQPPIMIVGGLAVLLSFIVQPIGQWVAYATWPFVAYTIRLVELFNRVPGGNQVVGEPALWQVLVFYIVLGVATWRWSTVKEKLTPNWKPASVFVGLFVLAVLVWQSVFHAPDGLLHITLLDVQEGIPGSVFIQTPEGRYLLINAGGPVRELSDELGRRLPIGRRQLDWLLIADPNDDWNLANIVPRFMPQQVLWASTADVDNMAGRLQTIFIAENKPVLLAQPGQRLSLGQGAIVEVVAMDNEGADLLIRWQNFEIALPSANPVLISGGVLPEAAYDWIEILTDGTEVWLQAQQ